MKHLKKINEIYDDSVRKSYHKDIPDIKSWDKYDGLEKILSQNVPYLNFLRFRKIGDLLEYKFNEYSDNAFFFAYILIYPEKKPGLYNLNMHMKCSETDPEDEKINITYNKNVFLNNLDKKELINILNTKGRKEMMDFIEHLTDKLGELPKKYDLIKKNINPTFN